MAGCQIVSKRPEGSRPGIAALNTALAGFLLGALAILSYELAVGPIWDRASELLSLAEVAPLRSTNSIDLQPLPEPKNEPDDFSITQQGTQQLEQKATSIFKMNSGLTSLATGVAKLQNDGRLIEAAFFKEELSPAARQAVLVSPDWSTPEYKPIVVLFFHFKPFTRPKVPNQCDLINLAEFQLRFWPDSKSSKFAEVKQAPSRFWDLINTIDCRRRKGAAFELQSAGEAKSYTGGGEYTVEWDLALNTVLH